MAPVAFSTPTTAWLTLSKTALGALTSKEDVPPPMSKPKAEGPAAVAYALKEMPSMVIDEPSAGVIVNRNALASAWLVAVHPVDSSM